VTLSLAACWSLPVLLTCGCWVTQEQGDRIKRVNENQDRSLAALRAELEQEREQLAGKMAKLEEMTAKAASVVTRDNADRGAQIDQLQERIALLEGQLAELRYTLERLTSDTTTRQADLEKRLDLLARKTGTDSSINAEEIPQDRAAHFQAGREAFDAGDFPKSRALLREFLNRYADDEKADDAQYLIGAGYLRENKPATALGELRKVISRYGEGDALYAALFDMAEAFYKLNACTDAKKALDALLRRTPPKAIKRKAEQKLREIEGAPPSYCTS